MTVQSIGPYIATAIAATVGDPRNFASGRHFAAWLGTDPKTAFYGRKRKAWRNKQARRQLYSVGYSFMALGRLWLVSARYDAELAERRYEAVDPGNRLIAATLETRWNDAVQRLHDLEAELAAFERKRAVR